MLILKSQAKQKDMENFSIIEYKLPDSYNNLAIAVGEITGPVPKAINRICTEMIYVISGKITVTYNDKTETAESEDQIVISPNTPYSLDGQAKFVVASVPAFYPEQHETLGE